MGLPKTIENPKLIRFFKYIKIDLSNSFKSSNSLGHYTFKLSMKS